MVPKYLTPDIEIKYTDPRSVPKRAYPTDAGADLFSQFHYTIAPGEQTLVDTGLSVKIPVGYVGLLFSRSGQGIIRVNLANSVGVIDSAYRGSLKLAISNKHPENYYEIVPFVTKIGQLVIVPIMLPNFVEYTGNWDDSDRGIAGFGSTG